MNQRPNVEKEYVKEIIEKNQSSGGDNNTRDLLKDIFHAIKDLKQ